MRVITASMFNKIRKLKRKGLSKTKIAKKLNIDRDTVAKYLKAPTPPGYSKREKSTRLDPFALYIKTVEKWLEKNSDLNSYDVFELLTEEGYEGSLSTVKRRLSLLKTKKNNERFFEQEYTPGEQCQFDFKERIQIPFWGGVKEVYLHFGTLPFSDKFFIRCYPSKNHECFVDGIHEFFNHIGGMTEAIRIDNLSPCVKKVLKGSDRLYTDSFKKVIDYYDFKVLPCRPAKGNDKGDVERDIRTYAKKILKILKLKNIKFESFDDANKWLKEFCEKRITATVQEAFKKEQRELLPLLNRRNEVLCKVEEFTVNSYGMIKSKHENAAFSVPDSSIGKKCRIFYGVHNLTIKHLDSDDIVATHPRYSGDSVLLEHVITSLIRKPAAMIRWAHKDKLFPYPIYKKLYDKLKKVRSWRAEQDYLRIINLIHHTSIDELTVAIELALESKSDNLLDKIEDLVLVSHRPDNILDISQHLNQEKLSIKLDNYNSLIPKGETDGTPRISTGTRRSEVNCNEGRVLKFSDYCDEREK